MWKLTLQVQRAALWVLNELAIRLKPAPARCPACGGHRCQEIPVRIQDAE